MSTRIIMKLIENIIVITFHYIFGRYFRRVVFLLVTNQNVRMSQTRIQNFFKRDGGLGRQWGFGMKILEFLMFIHVQYHSNQQIHVL